MFNLKLWNHVQQNCEKYGGSRQKSAPISYNTEAVIEAAENYISAQDEYRAISRRMAGHSLTSDELATYRKADGEASAAWDGLHLICKAVGADAESVIAICKSFRRYSQYRRAWNFVTTWHMGEQEKVGFRRAVQIAQ